MSCKAEAILALAKEQIGTTEYPPGSNTVKYNTAYYGRKVSGDGYPWCCAFVWWLFSECKSSELFYGGKKTASCTTLMNYAKKNGLWVTSDYKPGDLILYNFNSDSYSEHIGVCESAGKNYVTCIEGNTGLTNDANGGAVLRRTRSVSLVMGAYRPEYLTGGVNVNVPELKQGCKGRAVMALQALLTESGFICGGVDGDFGKLTRTAVMAYQTARSLIRDGIVGSETWTSLLNNF